PLLTHFSPTSGRSEPEKNMPNTPKRPFHTAADADIKRGEVSDVYFARTVQILKHRNDRKRVKAEVYLKSLPEDWPWGILAGIEEVAALLEGQPVDVWAMDEGTIFEPYQPILRIEGTYVEWAQYETALLGLLCQASGIATKAARCKKAAGERQVISFGARRMHPTLAPMIERNALIATRRLLSHPRRSPVGAPAARVRSREAPRLRRGRRVRDPCPESGRRRLRRRHLDRQRAGAQLRPRHHGDRGQAHGQARQVVGRQGRLPAPRHAGDRRAPGRQTAVRRRPLGAAAEAAGERRAHRARSAAPADHPRFRPRPARPDAARDAAQAGTPARLLAPAYVGPPGDRRQHP